VTLTPDELHNLLDLVKDERKLEKELNQKFREEKAKFGGFGEASSLQ